MQKRPVILRSLLIVATPYEKLSTRETYVHMQKDRGRLLKIIELFCRISSLLQGSFAKETYVHMQKDCERTRSGSKVDTRDNYGVATIHRLLQFIGVFCKRAL